MKKIGLIALAAALCGSCLARPEAEVVQQPATDNIDTSQVYTYTPETGVGTPAGTVAVSDADFYRSNIVVKTMGDDYVIYEYADVRVDKVATLAAQYCYETNPGKSAYLRDIYLQKNHKRRATFDCVDLATR